MLTAHELDQKFEIIPLGESEIRIVPKNGASNQSEIALHIAEKEVSKRRYVVEEIVIDFNYDAMVLLAAKIKDKNIANLHDIIWKLMCGDAGIKFGSKEAKMSRQKGRKPYYIWGGYLNKVSSANQQLSYCQTRMCAIYLATFFTDMNLSDLGKYFNKHHSTIIHARDQIQIHLESKDAMVTNAVVKMLNKLENYF